MSCSTAAIGVCADVDRLGANPKDPFGGGQFDKRKRAVNKRKRAVKKRKRASKKRKAMGIRAVFSEVVEGVRQ
jgi:hypothetical protein